MSETVINIENLYKEYKLGVISHGTLYRDLQSWWARIRGKEDPNSIISAHHSSDVEEGSFLALNDVSFEVKESEILGIIGKNGAGKSTLLKILSRITSPTKGEIKIKGRVGSLLEVGTGFHPELTGRENIYLNGAIFGMRKREINKKLDEIIDFAGIERHIDTPVKRYSSGMYVRLAFSVAAHLDPEILIVDEVLAVGDINFQKKCLGKMKDISKGQGRTVLFVSHNMNAISSLCNRCLLLYRGSIIANGPTSDVVLEYNFNSGMASSSKINYQESGRNVGNSLAELLCASIEDENGNNIIEALLKNSFFIKMRYRIKKETESILVPNIHFYTSDGTCVFVQNATDMKVMEPGDYEVVCRVPEKLLNEGAYNIGLAITSYSDKEFSVCFFEERVLLINIKDPMDSESNRYGYPGPIPGVVRPVLKWQIKEIN